jgi:hypothetical protein
VDAQLFGDQTRLQRLAMQVPDVTFEGSERDLLFLERLSLQIEFLLACFHLLVPLALPLGPLLLLASGPNIQLPLLFAELLGMPPRFGHLLFEHLGGGIQPPLTLLTIGLALLPFDPPLLDLRQRRRFSLVLLLGGTTSRFFSSQPGVARIEFRRAGLKLPFDAPHRRLAFGDNQLSSADLVLRLGRPGVEQSFAPIQFTQPIHQLLVQLGGVRLHLVECQPIVGVLIFRNRITTIRWSDITHKVLNRLVRSVDPQHLPSVRCGRRFGRRSLVGACFFHPWELDNGVRRSGP